MRSAKLTLAGFIESNWVKGGRPRLSWDDLLKRAIVADIQLEKLGLNPAKKFRILRLARDSSGWSGNSSHLQTHYSGSFI